MLEGRLARRLSIHRRRVDVAHAVVFVPDIAFLFEHAQLSADGGVGLAAWQIVHDLSRGGAAAAQEDIHDLTLAAGEQRMERPKHVIFIAHML